MVRATRRSCPTRSRGLATGTWCRNPWARATSARLCIKPLSSVKRLLFDDRVRALCACRCTFFSARFCVWPICTNASIYAARAATFGLSVDTAVDSRAGAVTAQAAATFAAGQAVLVLSSVFDRGKKRTRLNETMSWLELAGSNDMALEHVLQSHIKKVRCL